jgi:hypothetical protein
MEFSLFETLVRYFSQFHLVVLQLSCLFGLWHWKRLGPTFQILLVYLLVNWSVEMGAQVMKYQYKNNMPVLHVYILLEFIIWSFFYRSILGPKAVLKRYFWQILGAGIALIMLNTLFVQKIWTFSTYSKTLVQLFIIWMAIEFAFYIPENRSDTHPQNHALKPLNAGLIIYYCGSLFIFMSGFFATDKTVFMALRHANIFLNAIFQLLVLFSLWKVMYHRTKSSSSSASPS